MKQIKFTYTRNDKSTERNLAVLHETDKFYQGIDMDRLSPVEQEGLREVHRAYIEGLKPYNKAYRKFLTEFVTDLSIEEAK